MTTGRYLTVADVLRDEYDRRRKAGDLPRAGWLDAIRFLEDLSTSRRTERHAGIEHDEHTA